jgi:two-component system, OmpR family, sensor histidine kinase KdpD
MARTTLNRLSPARNYTTAVVACVVATLLALPLRDLFEAANIVMLFLLSVVLVAWRCGRGPAIVAAFLSVALFDFFFVPPQYSFAVSDVQYVLTFAVMLCVALIIGQLTAQSRRAAESALSREQRARALYEMARKLSGAVNREQTADITAHFLEESLQVRIALFLADRNDHLNVVPGTGLASGDFSTDLARAVYHRAEPSVFDQMLYLPLRAPVRLRGVLVATPWVENSEEHVNRRELLETVASMIAIVIERIHYVEVANDALLTIESERLRNTLLSALSHDLRTPLTALVGLADSLALARPPLPRPQQEMAAAIRDQSLRISHLVHNLLDMARFQAGPVKLRKEWQPLEEVVGSSLKSLDASLSRYAVKTRLAADLPLLEFDAVLIERVLFNLLDNAVKYSPAGGEVVVEAHRCDAFVEVSVTDNGAGVAPGSETALFEKFVRGNSESSTAGVGLGLAICRAIVEAHGGRIWAANRAEGGAQFVFTLPVGDPPVVDKAVLERIERGAPWANSRR